MKNKIIRKIKKFRSGSICITFNKKVETPEEFRQFLKEIKNEK